MPTPESRIASGDARRDGDLEGGLGTMGQADVSLTAGESRQGRLFSASHG